METQDEHFRVTLSVRKEPEMDTVYCKTENSTKFRQLKTVKFSCDTSYRFDISFKPPQLLESLEIGGKNVEITEMARDSIACAYSGHYSTDNIQPSLKGQREDLLILLKVFKIGCLTTSLQIKYYKPTDQNHCNVGSKLHCIELDYSGTEGKAYTANKETYQKFPDVPIVNRKIW